jgi:hypothetical protein
MSRLAQRLAVLNTQDWSRFRPTSGGLMEILDDTYNGYLGEIRATGAIFGQRAKQYHLEVYKLGRNLRFKEVHPDRPRTDFDYAYERSELSLIYDLVDRSEVYLSDIHWLPNFQQIKDKQREKWETR